ncbi:hypothetical protein GF407_04040 [candidate division KSB1 bacterium]|nr:hypothetical protein [candidate division KSB1 bacterium]
MNRIYFLIVMIPIIGLSSGFSQELVTDRPDFTESALVVPAGTLQIEAGAEYADFNSVTDFSCPAILARAGLGNRFEVRVGFGGWSKITVDDKSQTYLNDLILEAKYQLTETSATIPMALMLVSTLPAGDEEVSVGNTEIGIKYACSYDVNESIGLGVNFGAISVTAGDERQILSLASVALGVGLSDKLAIFLETFAEIPQNQSWQPVLDGGFTYLLAPLLQADFYIGKGLNGQSAELIIGAGVSLGFGI